MTWIVSRFHLPEDIDDQANVIFGITAFGMMNGIGEGERACARADTLDTRRCVVLSK